MNDSFYWIKITPAGDVPPPPGQRDMQPVPKPNGDVPPPPQPRIVAPIAVAIDRSVGHRQNGTALAQSMGFPAREWAQGWIETEDGRKWAANAHSVYLLTATANAAASA
jgi:hypothetical protein